MIIETINEVPLWDLQIARGFVTNAATIHKFGRNEDIDSGVAEDIWDYGGDWVLPTQARIHAIVSTSDEDKSGGTGASTMQIYGLDENFKSITETVNLNGIAGVNTANSYVSIHRMIVRTADGTGANVGTITATADTDGTVTAQISATKNQTLMACYVVPAETSLYLYGFCASITSNTVTKADIELYIKPYGEVYQVKNIVGIDSSGVGNIQHGYKFPLKIEAKSVVKLRATPTANNSNITGGFMGILT